MVYAPISLSERTCDAIDCLYDDRAEHINIGEKKGRAEGLAEGMEKGRAEGEVKGRAEERLKNARNLKKTGCLLT